MRRWLPIVAVLVACRSPLPEPGGEGAAQGPLLVVEPSFDPDHARPISRIRIVDADATDALLISGELSEYYIKKIRSGSPPKTLLERSVECTKWTEPGAFVMAPVAALDVGELYSVATPEHGLVGTLVVADGGPPLLERLFPKAATVSAPLAVYCGPDPLPIDVDAPAVVLEPSATQLAVQRGVFGGVGFDECVTLRTEAPLEPGAHAPPVELFGLQLDPTPWLVGTPPAATPSSCGAGEIGFGPGCAVILDDRVLVRSIDSPALWAITGELSPLLHAAGPSGRFSIRGLWPSTSYALDLRVVDLSASTSSTTFAFVTSASEPHIVINEVLANPAGAEPAQEWVELVNDGTAGVELEGYELGDSAGASVIPSHYLAPGEFVLLAREDFVRDDGTDVPVPASTSVLALASLGKNGLSNAGERLELRTPTGNVISVFPASPKPKSGVSVARREPGDFDDDEAAFALHSDPGASPGAPNQL